MDELKNRRLEIRLSEKVIKEIDRYQRDNGIAHRTTAIAELIRYALQYKK
jgi:metal-responsive CopG/Arc/MetJ family transcriptional regulator